MKIKCIWCGRDALCGCHDQEELFEDWKKVKDEGQFKIEVSDKEFEDFLDELDPE